MEKSLRGAKKVQFTVLVMLSRLPVVMGEVGRRSWLLKSLEK